MNDKNFKDAFQILGNTDQTKTAFASGELSENSKELMNTVESEINELKELNFNSSSDNVESQEQIVSKMNKIKAINQTVKQANLIYENLVIKDILKDFIGQMQDPNNNFSNEKKLRILELIIDHQARESINESKSSGGGININVSNTSSSEGLKVSNNTVEKALFNKQEIKGIEGLLESSKFIQDSLSSIDNNKLKEILSDKEEVKE